MHLSLRARPESRADHLMGRICDYVRQIFRFGEGLMEIVSRIILVDSGERREMLLFRFAAGHRDARMDNRRLVRAQQFVAFRTRHVGRRRDVARDV